MNFVRIISYAQKNVNTLCVWRKKTFQEKIIWVLTSGIHCAKIYVNILTYEKNIKNTKFWEDLCLYCNLLNKK